MRPSLHPTRSRGPVDVLFVNPPSPDGFVYIRDVNRHGRSSWERMIWPQTNLAILAAVAEGVGLSVDIVDCIAEGMDWPSFRRLLQQCSPRYCFSNLISVTYHNDLHALQLAKDLCGSVTVGMGPHLTAAPALNVLQAPCLDFAICHEPETTLRELLLLGESEGFRDLSSLSEVPGLCFVPSRLVPGADGTPLVTRKRDWIPDLDALPRARYDLLPLHKYWAPFLGKYVFIESSRGCPYKCTFCRQGVFYQWNYRTRSAASLAEEALALHALGVENILFHADTFTIDRRMVEELCDRLIAAGSPVRWACNSHAVNLHGKRDLLEKMRAAGCWMIAVGIESGDDQILRNIKKSADTSVIASAVRDIAACGIEVWGYFVIGFLGETPETIRKTIRFAKSLPVSIAKFDIGAPYPGTEFHEQVKAAGLLRITEVEEYDQNACAVVDYPELSAAQIRAGARRATLEFYLRPGPMIRVLRESLKPRSLLAVALIVRDQIRLLWGKGHARRRARFRTHVSTERSA